MEQTSQAVVGRLETPVRLDPERMNSRRDG